MTYGRRTAAKYEERMDGGGETKAPSMKMTRLYPKVG
jgi:hypothetical protein